MITHISVQQAIEKVWQSEWKDQKDGIQSRKNALVFAEYYGLNSTLNKLSTEDIRLYKAHCRGTLQYARATINRKLASVSKLITYVRGVRGFRFTWGTPLVEYETENNQRKFVFSSELEQKLRITCSQLGYGYLNGLWITLIETGCRLSEILNLRWTDIESEFITIVDTKNGEDRVVPIFEEVQDVLQEKKRQGLSKPFPFKSRHVEYVWTLIRKEMNMQDEKDFVIHALRHTCITRLLKQKVGIEVAQRIAGHRDIRMTQRYNHPTKEDIRDVLKLKRKES